MYGKKVTAMFVMLLFVMVAVCVPAMAATEEDANTDLVQTFDIDEMPAYLYLDNQTLETFENTTGIDGLEDGDIIVITVYHADGGDWTADLLVDDDEVVINGSAWNYTDIAWEPLMFKDNETAWGNPVYLDVDGDVTEVMPILPIVDDETPVYFVPITGITEIGGYTLEPIADGEELDVDRNISGVEDEITIETEGYSISVDDGDYYILPWEAFVSDGDWYDTTDVVFQLYNTTDAFPVVAVYNLEAVDTDEVTTKFFEPGAKTWWKVWEFAPAQTYSTGEFTDDQTLYVPEDTESFVGLETKTGYITDYKVFYSEADGFSIEKGSWNLFGPASTGDFSGEKVITVQNVKMTAINGFTFEDGEQVDVFLGLVVDNAATFQVDTLMYWMPKDKTVTVAAI